MTSEWVCTDPSCNQYRLKIGDSIYRFREDRIINPITKETKPYHSEIDLRDYTEKEIKDALESFGYKYVDGQVLDCTGELFSDAELIAECLFELES